MWVGDPGGDRCADVGRRLLGMSYVQTDSWGGLPITLMMSTFGLALRVPAFRPGGARAAQHRDARGQVDLCVVYVELIRGVPLISLLFMASVMFPLFMPAWVQSRTNCCALRSRSSCSPAAYLAEVVRGGLQSLPRGQYEAADALGLSYFHKTALHHPAAGACGS